MTDLSLFNSQFNCQTDTKDDFITIKDITKTLLTKSYLIKDINITRNPSKPGDKTGYGTFSNIQHTVNGFDLEHYSTEKYNDPVNQERLDFLRKISK